MSLELRTKRGTETLSYDAFEERVRLGEIGPEVEVRFPEVTGKDFTPAVSYTHLTLPTICSV